LFYQNNRVKTLAVMLFLVVFVFLVYFSITSDSSRRLVRILSEKSFPFEIVLLEGDPGLSEPERERIDEIRNKAAALGMYLITGVNISDARTYFLSFYAPPKDGISWLGWAYYPNDPEMEGPILEPLGNPFTSQPEPTTSKNDALAGIYHTHNAESYSGDGGEDRVKGGQNGDVAKVGQLLVEELNKRGIKAVQDDTVNDSTYTKAYDSSGKTAQKLLKENPTIRLLIDLHRDGLPPEVGKSTVKIKNKDVAVIMIVIGQKNPNWEKNNKIADDIIKIAQEKYPGLFSQKIRYASEARYNQHLTNGALLFEIGSQLNTAEEASAATGPLAEVLKEYLER